MKQSFTSKTVWFNIIVFVIALLAMPEFIKVLPSSWLQYDLLGGVVGNLILRIFFTNTGIGTPTPPANLPTNQSVSSTPGNTTV